MHAIRVLALAAAAGSIAATTASAGIMDLFFEDKSVQAQKAACEEAVRRDLRSYAIDPGSGTVSGFVRLDVLSMEPTGAMSGFGATYSFDLTAEGIWNFALAEPERSKGRYSYGNPLDDFGPRQVVDGARLARLGLIGSAQDVIWLNDAQQHIMLRGEAVCQFYSEDSPHPHEVIVTGRGAAASTTRLGRSSESNAPATTRRDHRIDMPDPGITGAR